MFLLHPCTEIQWTGLLHVVDPKSRSGISLSGDQYQHHGKDVSITTGTSFSSFISGQSRFLFWVIDKSVKEFPYAMLPITNKQPFKKIFQSGSLIGTVTLAPGLGEIDIVKYHRIS